MKSLKKVRKEVDQLCDKLSNPIDEKIKDLVVGLRYHGIKTTASCQGHLDRGLSHPWVQVDHRSLHRLLRAVSRENRPNLLGGSENTNIWVFEPVAGDLRLIPKNKNLPLEYLQKQAVEFGIFLQKMER
jgi:hypothetical protein